jgi:hypothetical protein
MNNYLPYDEDGYILKKITTHPVLNKNHKIINL